MDDTAPAGISYYRVKQVDFDGHFVYFPLVSVTHNGVGGVTGDSLTFSASVSNHVAKLWFDQGVTSASVELKVIDLSGRELAKVNQGSLLNSKNLTVELPAFQSAQGIYFLVLTLDGHSSARQVVITE